MRQWPVRVSGAPWPPAPNDRRAAACWQLFRLRKAGSTFHHVYSFPRPEVVLARFLFEGSISCVDLHRLMSAKAIASALGVLKLAVHENKLDIEAGQRLKLSLLRDPQQFCSRFLTSFGFEASAGHATSETSIGDMVNQRKITFTALYQDLKRVAGPAACTSADDKTFITISNEAERHFLVNAKLLMPQMHVLCEEPLVVDRVELKAHGVVAWAKSGAYALHAIQLLRRSGSMRLILKLANESGDALTQAKLQNRSSFAEAATLLSCHCGRVAATRLKQCAASAASTSEKSASNSLASLAWHQQAEAVACSQTILGALCVRLSHGLEVARDSERKAGKRGHEVVAPRMNGGLGGARATIRAIDLDLGALDDEHRDGWFDPLEDRDRDRDILAGMRKDGGGSLVKLEFESDRDAQNSPQGVSRVVREAIGVIDTLRGQWRTREAWQDAEELVASSKRATLEADPASSAQRSKNDILFSLLGIEIFDLE